MSAENEAMSAENEEDSCLELCRPWMGYLLQAGADITMQALDGPIPIPCLPRDTTVLFGEEAVNVQ